MVAENDILRNVLQGLIVGSGVNWAASSTTNGTGGAGGDDDHDDIIVGLRDLMLHLHKTPGVSNEVLSSAAERMSRRRNASAGVLHLSESSRDNSIRSTTRTANKESSRDRYSITPTVLTAKTRKKRGIKRKDRPS